MFDTQTLDIGPECSELCVYALAVLALYVFYLSRTGRCPPGWVTNLYRAPS
jgi:hypothetical protein